MASAVEINKERKKLIDGLWQWRGKVANEKGSMGPRYRYGNGGIHYSLTLVLTYSSVAESGFYLQ